MKKKILFTILFSLIISFTTACSNNKGSNDSKAEVQTHKVETEKLNDSAFDNKSSNPEEFKINDLSFNLSIDTSNPNWVEISGTYTNNSAFSITQIIVTYIDHDTNETEYWGSHDTVLPGETSPTSTGDTIDNLNASLDRMEAIEYRITCNSSSGEEFDVVYDVKLDEYSIY